MSSALVIPKAESPLLGIMAVDIHWVMNCMLNSGHMFGALAFDLEVIGYNSDLTLRTKVV